MSKFSGRKNASVAANDTSSTARSGSEFEAPLKQNLNDAFVRSFDGGVAFPHSFKDESTKRSCSSIFSLLNRKRGTSLGKKVCPRLREPAFCHATLDKRFLPSLWWGILRFLLSALRD